MKLINKLALIAVLLLSVSQLSAQQINLELLPEAQRDSVLIEIAKKAILKYGPDYYRDYTTNPMIEKPAISHFFASDTADLATSYPELTGKKIYRVKLFYDKTEEELDEDYAAIVGIVAESGVVASIAFGNTLGYGVYPNEMGIIEPYNGVMKYRGKKLK